MDQSLFSIPEPKPFSKLLSLEGRAAIVTGGGRGLGKYVVRRFAEAGGDVVFCARHADQLNAVAEEYAQLPGTLVPLVADVSSKDDRLRIVDEAIERFGGVDILVNCAAIYPPGNALSVTEKTWDDMHDIDVKAGFFLSTSVARRMIEQGRGGRIINFLSTAFVNAAPMFAAYAIAKAGMWEMTRVLSKELAPHRITVNAVTPGATFTEEKAAALASGDIASALSALGMAEDKDIDLGKVMSRVMAMGGPGALIKQRMPMGRPGYPQDLADAVLYLASDMASYVTGQNIVVDGGQADNSTFDPFDDASDAPDVPSAATAKASAVGQHADPSSSNDPDPGLAGMWCAQVETPMGKQEVEIDAQVNGTTLTGTMLFMGKRLDIRDGRVSKAGFTYSIQLKAMLRKMEATVRGERDGDTLTGTVSNPMGEFPFTAKRG